MRNVDIIRDNPYDLFRYFRVWFEASKPKVPMIDGRPMLLLYMGAECEAKAEHPRPMLGVPNAFYYELPNMKIYDLRQLAERYYIYGIFFSRNIMNAPEELFVKQHTKCVNEELAKHEGVQKWTFNSVLGLVNLTPPLLPPSMPLRTASQLKAYAMQLDDSDEIHTQAHVGKEQYWKMDMVSFDNNDGFKGIHLTHPAVENQLSVPLSWLMRKTNQTEPGKMLESIAIEMKENGYAD